MALAPVGYYNRFGVGSHGFIGGIERDNSGIQVLGIKEILQRFNAISPKHPDMDTELKNIIRYVINETRKRTSKNIHDVLPNDTKQAYRAVKSLVYKRIFGGNVSLLSKRKAGRRIVDIEPPKTHTGRGGNRMKRSIRTETMMSYWGADRGFVLRFLNQGTCQRYFRTRLNWRCNNEKLHVGRGHTSASVQQYKRGRRGKIKSNDFFEDASISAMDSVAYILTESIEEAIQKYWSGQTLTNTNYSVLGDD